MLMFIYEPCLGLSDLLLQVFNSFLKTQFKGVPGEEQVLEKQYLILQADGNRIDQEEWAITVFPGSSLVMSVLMDRVAPWVDENRCPRSGCSGHAKIDKDEKVFKIWYFHPLKLLNKEDLLTILSERCDMKFSSKPRHLDNQFRQQSDQTTEAGARLSQRKSRAQEQNLTLDVGPTFMQEQALKEEVEESEFWIQRQTQNIESEWRAFKRVHLQAMSQFLQTIHRIVTSYYQTYDINHTRAKFPRAETYLVERLGKAVSRRRQYVQYRKGHHMKLNAHMGYFSSTYPYYFECPVCFKMISHNQTSWS